MKYCTKYEMLDFRSDHSQNKSDESHVPPPGCLTPQVQRLLDQGRISSCNTHTNKTTIWLIYCIAPCCLSRSLLLHKTSSIKLTHRLQSLHCWWTQSAAQWLWWFPACELQHKNTENQQLLDLKWMLNPGSERRESSINQLQMGF